MATMKNQDSKAVQCSDSVDIDNISESLKEVLSQGFSEAARDRPGVPSSQTEVKSLDTLDPLTVSGVLRTAHLTPEENKKNEALERLWASSAEVDHQLQSMRSKQSEEMLPSETMQREILKKGKSDRSFFTKSKSARAVMA